MTVVEATTPPAAADGSVSPPARRAPPRVRDLRKVYGHLAAVDGVSFYVRRGEIFGLLGSNGAGKTTTVETVQGLRTPYFG